MPLAAKSRHTFLTDRTKSLDTLPASSSRLRSWKAMNTRAASIDHHLGAKDQLCVPHMFSFGHVRQLDAVVSESLRRAWSLGTGPGSGRLVVDIDSTICQVYGKAKSGAAYGYTKVLGYHPIVAVRAGTGEVLHARMRKGSANTARGAKRFVEELVARAGRAGASGEMVMRFDSGFWSNATIATLGRLGVRYTMAVRCANSAVAKAISTIEEGAWAPIAYTPDGIAQVAEADYGGRRLIVRRTRLADAAQQALFPGWRHNGFLTDLPAPAVEVDRFHREHAAVELAIRDIKEGSGLEHCPSGNFNANGAWLACAVLAHDLCRWTAMVGQAHPADQLTVVATLRARLICVPGRLVNRAGTQLFAARSTGPGSAASTGPWRTSGHCRPSPRAELPAAWRPATLTSTLTTDQSPRTLDQSRHFAGKGPDATL